MSRAQKTWQKILNGQVRLRFGEFEVLMLAFGFELIRVSGSHRIYRHGPTLARINIQPRKGETKPYQVRQFLVIIEEHGLTLNE